MKTESRINCFSFLRGSRVCRSLFAIPLALVLFTPVVRGQGNIIELTNADVLAMVRDKVPSDVIITKIQTSRCNFDTFPTVISELRYRGVPEEVLVAMVEAPVGRATKRVDETAKRTSAGSPTDTPSQKSPTGSGTKPTVQASAAPKEKPTSESQKVVPTGSATASRTGSVKSGSGTAASTKESSTVQMEKTVTAAPTGKASLPPKQPPKQIVAGPAAKTQQTPPGPRSIAPTEKATIETLPPMPKQNQPSRAATLPLPEPVRVESKASVNPAKPTTDSAATQPTDSVTPVKTEKPATHSAAAASTEQLKQPSTRPQVLTNADIIKLLRGGSPSTAVVATIKASPGNYDLSAKGLVELQAAGADATVFLSMMETSQKSSEEKTASSGTNGSKKPE